MAVRYLILDIGDIRSNNNHLNGSLETYNLRLDELLSLTISALTNIETYYHDQSATDLARRLLYRALSSYNEQHRKDYTLEDVDDVCSIGLKIYKRLYPTILSFYQQHPFTHLVVARCIGDDLYVECS